MGKNKGKKSKKTKASTADKYVLYQKSVQEPDVEVEFFSRAFKREFDRPAKLLREDFCGTFAICCEWIKSKKDRRAIGVDLDPEPLNWGRKNNLAKVDEASQQRVKLLQDDVRVVSGDKADVLSAQNFSFWIFKTRKEVLEYFKAAYSNMADESVMVLDMMGGPECMDEEQTDVRSYKGFKYEWEQARFDPISHDCKFHIHFAFKDGSRLDKAFTYEWRFWSIPEVRELLEEAGFARADVYWEGTDEDGEGNGIYRRREHAPSDACWIAYIVAVKK